MSHQQHQSLDQFARGVMSGAARGPRAAVLRGALACAEPFYASAMRVRNRLYDAGVLRARRLPRPTVSVGNITSGGTGKTPVVRWLAQNLRDEGRKVAVLSRGYKAGPGGLGDEQVMLDRYLNGATAMTPGAAEGPHAMAPSPPYSGERVGVRGLPSNSATSNHESQTPLTPALSPAYRGEGGGRDAPLAGAARPRVVIVANPDRLLAAEEALREEPGTELFVLDDGFQHRRAARDLDVVLINAADPFGFGRVLPRGLLREPLSGLRRAGAIVVTRWDQAGADERERIVATVRRHNPNAPLYRAAHVHAGFRTAAAPASAPPDLALEALRGRRFFAFSGIGDPDSLGRQLQSLGGTPAAVRRLADHARYKEQDLAALRGEAHAAGAEVMLTTEKDWVKLSAMPAAAGGGGDVPIWRVELEVRFEDGDGSALLAQVRGLLADRGRG